MSWSGVKQRMAEFIIPPLQGRVQFYITSYRRDHGNAQVDARDLGRAWVTVDGEEILSYSGKAVQADSEFSRQSFFQSLKDYPDRSIEQSLESPDELVRGIAMIDRRLGKRRLARLKVEDEKEFVKTLFKLRCEVEGMGKDVSSMKPPT